jgi:ATP-dependent RNA helicase HelY
MYNSITATAIMTSPHLEELNVERLPQKLTEAYARITSARVSVPQTQDRAILEKILDEISRLGYTYLALVNFTPNPEIQRSAAFVAGSAFELIATYSGEVTAGKFTTSSICQTCSAALLFMIADAASDAAEIIKYLPATDDKGSLEDCLRFAIQCLAFGDIAAVTEMPTINYGDELTDINERAVATLYNGCLNGIKELCRSLTGHGNINLAITIFEQTMSVPI